MRDTARLLHVTNGDSAASRIRDALGAGEVLPWRDALHEGPVPAGLDPASLRAVRAHFIAACGWADGAEELTDLCVRDERLDAAVGDGEPIALWFEADVYDLLQLAQILDRVPAAHPARLVLVGIERFRGVAELSAEELRSHYQAAAPVGARDRAHAAALWDAFRSSDPRALEQVPPGGPFGAAAHRLLQQLPWTGSGLNRTERALLAAVAEGARTREAAFVAQQRAEERPFMGDSIAFGYLDALPVTATLELTGEARAILAGEREWDGRPERTYGGVTLPAGRSPWRYDPAADALAYEPS